MPDAGVGLLVTTDDDPAAARRLADELAALAWSLRHDMIVRNTPPAEAVAEAIAFPEGPVMLVDVGDNIGGGTPGDGTVLLAELLPQGAREATVVIADAEAARAGVRGGGRRGRCAWPSAARPTACTATRCEVEGGCASSAMASGSTRDRRTPASRSTMGPTAVLRCGGVNLVLTSRKSMPGDQQQLKSVGIDPTRQQIIVVKAAVRWRGGYGPIAKHAIHVDTPGLGSVDLGRFPYASIRRPIFPLDPAMEWAG